MKLNDIYNNLEKTLNLKKVKRFLLVENELIKSKNIDSLKKENLEEIELKRTKNIKITEIKKECLDWIVLNKERNINLKKIIKNSQKISYKIKQKIRDIISFFYKTTHPKKKEKKTYRILAYITVIFALIFLDKILIENLTISWINNLYNIKNTNNIKSIESQLSKAKTKFNIANILFTPFKIIPEKNIRNVDNTIITLNQASWLGLNIIDFYKENINYIEKKEIDKIYFANLIENSKGFFLKTELELEKIKNNLWKIKLNRESQNHKKLEETKKQILYIKENLSIINNNFETFLNILWKDKSKTYFIVFQNNDEIRATWGFMWSAAILEIFAWKIKSFETKDIYALEWDVNKNYTEKVKAPSWVNMLSERLWLRDSNAYIDFSKSSKSINYFIKKWWYDIDWVIYINQKVIIDLLEKIWELNFSKYDSKINHKNFSEIISILVEAKVSKTATLDTPKQVLFDFSNLLIEKINKEKKYLEVLETSIKNIKSRDIVFYSFNKKENELLKKLWLNGNFDYEEKTDFNYPFFISVWWNKTDRYIKRSIVKNIKIEEINNKCSLKTNIELILENTFNKEDENRIKSLMKKYRIKENLDLLYISWKWLNQTYTKVIIPKNAIIDEKQLYNLWYKIIKHSKYNTVEKLLKTSSWEKSYFNINYKIDNIDCEIQNIKIYKQAWVYEYNIDFNYLSNIQNKKIKLNWLEWDFYYNSENNTKIKENDK